VPSITELLFDLGLEDRIIGVTKFCVHPQHIRSKSTVVGGTKMVHVDKIKALQPDIIICNKEENTQGIVESLMPVAPVFISDINTLEECYDLISRLGVLFGASKNSEKLIDSIQSQRKEFQHFIKDKPHQKIAYFIWKNPWMVVGSSTFIGEMIKEAGFENAFENIERYPEIKLNNVNLQKADLIFLSSEPYPFNEKDISALNSKFSHHRIRIVDGELFSWYGSRLQNAFEYFKTLH
jgi:ABC-type Fe3+-hydroxamate transport system substrate-binding protein